MPEGDTLYSDGGGSSAAPRGPQDTVASARQPGPRADRLVGATVESVESRGKQLLIHFDSGWSFRTHLACTGSWHRYAAGERWHRPAARARLALEVEAASPSALTPERPSCSTPPPR